MLGHRSKKLLLLRAWYHASHGCMHPFLRLFFSLYWSLLCFVKLLFLETYWSPVVPDDMMVVPDDQSLDEWTGTVSFTVGLYGGY